MMDKSEVLAGYLRDLKRDADAMQDQREAANADMRFINVTGGMWEDFLTREYGDRTRLEFDLVSDYVQRFIGEWNQNRVGVNFNPDDDATTDDDAEFLDGVYRADYRHNSGKLAVDNAVDEAATCGYGAVKLATVYEDEGDPENDNQRIEFRPIHNAASSVFWSDQAKRIDKRDAPYVTEIVGFTVEAFKEKYPESSPVSAYTPSELMLGNWRTNQTDFIYVAVRYEVVTKPETYYVYANIAEGKTESYPADEHEKRKADLEADEMREFVRERKIKVRQVAKTVFSGAEILEQEKRIAGKHIPIVPIYGYRSFVDGTEWYRGLVRKLMDAMRLFNMQVSQLAENSASSGQQIPIFTREQIAGFEHDWADRNNKPYLLLNPTEDAQGNMSPMGPIGYLQPGALDASTDQLLNIVPNFIASITGGVPQETLDPHTSGKAINALIKRNNLNTQVINDNIECSLEWLGEVYQGMAPEVYSTARSVPTIGVDGTESRRKIGEYVINEKTGQLEQTNIFRGKKFRAYAKAGPQYQTAKEETVEIMKGVIELAGQYDDTRKYVKAALAVMIANTTGVGMETLKDIARQDLLVDGHIQPETDEEKALVEQAAQPKEDPQQAYLAAAAEKELAEARNLDASSIDHMANAEKRGAEAQKTLVEIQEIAAETEGAKVKTLLEIRKEQFKAAQRLPFDVLQ